MQATKDTFYLTLRDRLVQAYPARTITVDGITRPAIVVAENDKPNGARLRNAFYLEWGAAHVVRPAISALMAMTCTLSYSSAGSEQNGGLDRGRMVGELESELFSVCSPAMTQKKDCTSVDPVDLGTNMFWSQPSFVPAKAETGCVAREASITVYFYPEVNQS